MSSSETKSKIIFLLCIIANSFTYYFINNDVIQMKLYELSIPLKANKIYIVI